MLRAREAKFNAAFSIAWKKTGDLALGAACTISTIQTMTQVPIDAFVIVDMAGFAAMVDAVGGVQICAPTPLRDPRYTRLNLDAGWHDLKGVEALQYVRARHIKGTDGTDTGRIERQQRFIGALMREVMSSDVLTNPIALGRFLDAATSSLTVSAELGSATEQLGLAWGIRDLRADDVTFVTVPWAFGSDGYVEGPHDADLLWERLRADPIEVKDVPLKLESKITAGKAVLYMERLYSGPTGASVTFRTANGDWVQNVEFLDAQGKPIGSSKVACVALLTCPTPHGAALPTGRARLSPSRRIGMFRICTHFIRDTISVSRPRRSLQRRSRRAWNCAAMGELDGRLSGGLRFGQGSTTLSTLITT